AELDPDQIHVRPDDLDFALKVITPLWLARRDGCTRPLLPSTCSSCCSWPVTVAASCMRSVIGNIQCRREQRHPGITTVARDTKNRFADSRSSSSRFSDT